jgi:hypothetical protein
MADESRRIGRIGGLRAGHDCGTCADMLEDIRRTPRGNDIRLPIGPNTTSGVSPAQGRSSGRQADTAVVGGPAGGGHAGISQSVVDLSQIPVDNPYEYEPIHPYDDRYDFRLGKKVNDIGINGINPLGPQSFPSPESQFDNPGVQTTPNPDAGDPRGRDQIPDVGGTPSIVEGYNVGEVDPALAAAQRQAEQREVERSRADVLDPRGRDQLSPVNRSNPLPRPDASDPRGPDQIFVS